MHEHIFKPSDKDGYEVCDCGTYHSIAAKEPKEIYEADYWEHENGRSTFEEQRFNVTEKDSCGISKVDKILQYIPERSVLEIGAAPGELLKALNERGYVTYGIEPDPQYIEPILRVSPFSRIIQGYFPDVFKGIEGISFDYIIAMDVVEHSVDYDVFIKEVYRLLKPHGTFIFMSPIITSEYGDVRAKDYKKDEHIWILSEQYLKEYLCSMFSIVGFDFWQDGHNVIVCKK
jgi:2-polyprenyl-3-methyl-5-hydroxy-6-metoxy-1,4-benzoquinol methylase